MSEEDKNRVHDESDEESTPADLETNEVDEEATVSTGVNPPEDSRTEPVPESAGTEDLTVENLALLESNNATELSVEEEEAESEDNPLSSSSSSSASASPSIYEGGPPAPPPNPNPFYTTTPLPPLLHTCREARSIALKHYSLFFPNPIFHPARIFYNPLLDTLYFPTWAFPRSIRSWEKTLSPAVKSTIRRVAIDNLMWFSYWDKGSINCTFQIDQFKNVKELVLVARNPGKACACCMEFGVEEGIVGFMEEEATTTYLTRCVKKVKKKFVRIKERDEEWNVPGLVRCVRLMRDGVLV